MVVIAADLLERVIAHARRDAPNECCGLVGTRDGRAASVHEAENTAASPFRFEVDGMELYREMTAIASPTLPLCSVQPSRRRSLMTR